MKELVITMGRSNRDDKRRTDLIKSTESCLGNKKEEKKESVGKQWGIRLEM